MIRFYLRMQSWASWVRCCSWCGVSDSSMWVRVCGSVFICKCQINQCSNAVLEIYASRKIPTLCAFERMLWVANRVRVKWHKLHTIEASHMHISYARIRCVVLTQDLAAAKRESRNTMVRSPTQHTKCVIFVFVIRSCRSGASLIK